MRKTTRSRATKLLKELPPEPTAAAVRWDASLSADHYIYQAASAIAQTEGRLSIFREAALPDEWFRVEIERPALGLTVVLRYAKVFGSSLVDAPWGISCDFRS